MFKAVIVFCLIGTTPCTTQNAVLVIDKGGEHKFCPFAQAANVKEAAKLNAERGNGEYFTILCLPATP